MRLWATDSALPLDAVFGSHDVRAALGRFKDLAGLVEATRHTDDTLHIRWLHSHGIAGVAIRPSRIRKLQLLLDHLLGAEAGALGERCSNELPAAGGPDLRHDL